MGARAKIRLFFENNVGKVITTRQIQRIAKISEYARRIRELRDEEGMQIKSHIDRHDLKPGEYILESVKRIPVVARGISSQLRAEILERNGYTCRRCGAGSEDPDPVNLGRRLRLHVDHVIPVSQGGTNEKENLLVLCSCCNQGKANIRSMSETAVNLIARIRKTPKSVRREVYEFLKKSLGEEK